MSIQQSRATPAVVLRARPLGEADLVVVLLTATMGKVSAAARSARRSRKRFPGGLPAGAVGEAHVVPGRGSLMRFESFVPARDHGVLGRDLERFAYVAYVCELTDELVLEREPDPGLFARVHGTIVRLCEATPHPMVLRRFELGLLADLGHLPALDACCVCGAPLETDRGAVGFDPGRGGALCGVHRAGATGVSPEALALARELLVDPSAPDRSQTAPAAIRQEVRDLVLRMLRLQLRRPLKSTEFFRALPRTRDPGS